MSLFATSFFDVLDVHGQLIYRLAYDDWGNKQDPTPVFCVHGLTNTRHDFDVLAHFLLGQGRRIITVDMVGRGASDWAPDPSYYYIPRYAEDCAHLIKSLGIDAVDWVGISMGGLIGVRAIVEQQVDVRHLILDDVAPEVAAMVMGFMADHVSHRSFSLDEEAFIAKRLHHMQNIGPLTQEQRLERARHDFRIDEQGHYVPHFDPDISYVLRKDASERRDWNDWDLYAKITCPTLVLHGVTSEILTERMIRQLQAAGPKATVCDIEGVGHFPALADRHQLDVVSSFLNTAGVPPELCFKRTL